MTEDDFNLSYNFSTKELMLLARFLRDNQENLPDGLFKFSEAVEKKIYSNLSMKDVKVLYS